jgi:hypothetical protein
MRLPHFLDVMFAALYTGHLSPPTNIPSTHFHHRMSVPQGHIVAGRFMSIEKSNDFIRNRTHDLPACRTAIEPTTLVCAQQSYTVNSKLLSNWRTPSSAMLRRVALVRTDVSEEHSASIFRVTKIGELGTTLAVTSIVPSSPILVILMMEALHSSETSVLTRAAWHNIPEDGILQRTQILCSCHFTVPPKWQVFTAATLVLLKNTM